MTSLASIGRPLENRVLKIMEKMFLRSLHGESATCFPERLPSFYFIIETHSLPNAHSLLPSQLYLLCCSSRSLHSYFLILTSYFVHEFRYADETGDLPVLRRDRAKAVAGSCS